LQGSQDNPGFTEFMRKIRELGQPGQTPGASQITGISATPKRAAYDPRKIVDLISNAENLTAEGAKANPIQNAVGKTAGFLIGGNQGIGTSKQGVLTNPVTGTIFAGLAGGMGASPAVPAAAGFSPELQAAAGLEGSTAGAGAPAVASYLERGAQTAWQGAKAVGGKAADAAAWLKSNAIPAAFAYHIARELGIPLPKVLDVLSSYEVKP
jgi:hypothetical protein